jgi:hypothetical protein
MVALLSRHHLACCCHITIQQLLQSLMLLHIHFVTDAVQATSNNKTFTKPWPHPQPWIESQATVIVAITSCCLAPWLHAAEE